MGVETRYSVERCLRSCLLRSCLLVSWCGGNFVRRLLERALSACAVVTALLCVYVSA